MRSIALACVLLLVGCAANDENGPSPQVSTLAGKPAAASQARAPEPSASATALPQAPTSAAPVAMMEATKRDVREPTDWRADLGWSGSQRVAHAKSAKLATVTELFDKAGASWPPKDVLYRVFKQEGEFEVWAGDGASPLKLIATYGICAASGGLGPKRREGDLQVPEGFYKVGYYYPTSSYYLAAQVDYPNQSDKLRGGPSPGSDILIHGRCASIGCISMTDERIEEIYLVGWTAFMAGKPTHIHIFPGRQLDTLLADPKYQEHHAFWNEIKPGLAAFDASHRIPTVTIEKDGSYSIGPAP